MLPGSWCPGAWIMVPRIRDHAAALLLPWTLDHGALPDPDTRNILDLVQRSPGALDHGSIPWVLVALDPGAWIRDQGALVHGS